MELAFSDICIVSLKNAIVTREIDDKNKELSLEWATFKVNGILLKLLSI